MDAIQREYEGVREMLYFIIFILVLIILVLLINQEKSEELHASQIEALNDQKMKLLSIMDQVADDMNRDVKRVKRWKK